MWARVCLGNVLVLCGVAFKRFSSSAGEVKDAMWLIKTLTNDSKLLLLLNQLTCEQNLAEQIVVRVSSEETLEGVMTSIPQCSPQG